MVKRIVILAGTHLCNNPRVLKEAEALGRASYDATVLGVWLDSHLRERDRALASCFTFTPVVDLTEGGPRRLIYRAKGKVARLAYRVARIETYGQLGYAGREQYHEAVNRKADLYIAHSEQAIGVAADLLHRGYRVAVDMEDWFSEDLLPKARKHRPTGLIRSLERELLSQGVYSSCPSRAMSNAIAQEYGCRAPAVVYNAFPWAERRFIDNSHEDRINLGVPSIHWFSQTLGEGRGLEDLFSALRYLNSKVEIHLRGTPTSGFQELLSTRVPEAWRARLFIHPQVPNEKLLSRIAEHDIGFAGETTLIRSRDLTVTNKILYYLLAGLTVVASDTAGQREVAAQAPGGVFLYPSGDPAALAACLDRLLGSADTLRRAKAAALDAAERTFCWERQEKALLDSIARVLRSPGATQRTQSPVPV
jgi:glycosyltransferase involved in cell wall biosynthesis